MERQQRHTHNSDAMFLFINQCFGTYCLLLLTVHGNSYRRDLARYETHVVDVLTNLSSILGNLWMYLAIKYLLICVFDTLLCIKIL